MILMTPCGKGGGVAMGLPHSLAIGTADIEGGGGGGVLMTG